MGGEGGDWKTIICGGGQRAEEDGSLPGRQWGLSRTSDQLLRPGETEQR